MLLGFTTVVGRVARSSIFQGQGMLYICMRLEVMLIAAATMAYLWIYSCVHRYSTGNRQRLISSYALTRFA